MQKEQTTEIVVYNSPFEKEMYDRYKNGEAPPVFLLIPMILITCMVSFIFANVTIELFFQDSWLHKQKRIVSVVATLLIVLSLILAYFIK